MIRKECRKFYFSVEGETEKLYLEWLERQINKNAHAKFSVKLISKVAKNPNKMVKQITVLSDIEIVHVFDFEDTQNEVSFKNTLANMKVASKLKKKVKYKLGYSNFAFDLWIILHKECLMGKRSHRSNYLVDINRCYNTKFCSMAEYKEKANFNRILDKLSLDNVLFAIENAEKVEKQNSRYYHIVNYCGYEYYRENPSLSIHRYIKNVLVTVGLI